MTSNECCLLVVRNARSVAVSRQEFLRRKKGKEDEKSILGWLASCAD